MTKLTAKSSTIFIASGDTTRVYHSMSDVPRALRRKLEQSTSGTHSATILIADRRGRQELVRALQTQAMARAAALKAATPVPTRSAKRRVDLRSVGVVLPVLVGILIWLFIANRF